MERLTIADPSELEDAIADAITVEEDAPEGEEYEPGCGEIPDGVLSVTPKRILVICKDGSALPDEVFLRVGFSGWCETEEMREDAHGDEIHLPASVTCVKHSEITRRGVTRAEYRLTVEHSG